MVTDLLTDNGHLYTIGTVSDSPMCRKCGKTEDTSYHLLCECDFITILRQLVVGKHFPDLKDVGDMHVKDIPKTAGYIRNLKIRNHSTCLNIPFGIMT